MRCSVSVANVRRVLCVFPVYSPAFGTFSHAYELMRDVRGFMPPQGLLLIAAYLPERWQVRFIDENIAPASAADFQWADVVLVSGMHIQAPQIRDVHRRAKAAGKVMALGGPSASASPELYPDVDFLHIGELGDGTDALIATLNHSVARPVSQVRFTTRERLPLTEFPIPAYHLAALSRYAMCTLQFSSGCPYLCEFCDIPGLYGRQPRFKSAKQVLAELDAMCRQTDYPPVVYFVDDNFIGNRRAARDMLPHLIDWQRRHAYPMRFACEATLNIAKQTEILGLMRDAAFIGIFCGIETPEADALKAMRKDQNNALPMVDAVRTLNRYGLEVTSGIILGLDTDSADTEAHLKEFIELTQIPMLTVNLLTALPKTLLWDRQEGRTAGRRSTARKQRRVPAALRRGDGDVSPLDQLRQHTRATVRALLSSDRCDLCQPDSGNAARPAHLVQFAQRRGHDVQHRRQARREIRLPSRVLAYRNSCIAARPGWRTHGPWFRRLSPDRVHARCLAWRAERLVLRRQAADLAVGATMATRGCLGATQIGLKAYSRNRLTRARSCGFGSSVIDHKA